MNREALQALCQTFPGVQEDIKWQEHLCFCVAEKIFLITHLRGTPCPASFKVPEPVFHALCQQEGFRPAPHLGRYHWIQVADLGVLSPAEWELYARQSYDLVVAKLPKRLRP